MKTALDLYERGKQKEVNADEYDGSRNSINNFRSLSFHMLIFGILFNRFTW